QASADVAGEEAVEPPSPEAERAELGARFARPASTHQMQRVDGAWAPSAEASLATGLDSVAGPAGVDVLEMQCRASSCRLDMRFGSRDAARTNTEALVHTVYPGLNCARHMYASEPGDPTDSYEAALYLDCSLQRAGQVLPPE